MAYKPFLTEVCSQLLKEGRYRESHRVTLMFLSLILYLFFIIIFMIFIIS